MKRIFMTIIMLLMFSVFVNAQTNDSKNENQISTHETIPNLSSGGYIMFYGVLDIYQTQSGATIITCDPPFLSRCYSLWWSPTYPKMKTIILNDDNQTEIKVKSGPTITTGSNGEKIYTFSK